MRRLLAGARDALLDASVTRSFDRSGYARHARGFDPHALDVDLAGKVCLITGANSGLGFATARALAARGGEVWLLCRDPARGEAARARIAEGGGGRAVLEVLDVSSLAAVRAFAARFPRPRVDVLVHSAGIMADVRRETSEGHEVTLATHLLGPLLLTELLAPRLASAGGRVITISSGGMYLSRLRVGELEARRVPFDGMAVYAHTKRAQVVLTRLWAERRAELGVGFHAMHPGWVDTPALRGAMPRFVAAFEGRLRAPDEGADTVVWLAVTRSPLESGRFWFDRAPRPVQVVPWTRERAAERDALWERLFGWVGLAAR